MILDNIETWRILFLIMAVIALILAMLAEPIATGYRRRFETTRQMKKRKVKNGTRKRK